MAMTNKMLIELYKAENNISCPLHTFLAWKKMGYSVRKGEKSQHKITIWKNTTKKSKSDDGAEITTSKMVMTTACFFTINQVEKLEKSCKVTG